MSRCGRKKSLALNDADASTAACGALALRTSLDTEHLQGMLLARLLAASHAYDMGGMACSASSGQLRKLAVAASASAAGCCKRPQTHSTSITLLREFGTSSGARGASKNVSALATPIEHAGVPFELPREPVSPGCCAPLHSSSAPLRRQSLDALHDSADLHRARLLRCFCNAPLDSAMNCPSPALLPFRTRSLRMSIAIELLVLPYAASAMARGRACSPG